MREIGEQFFQVSDLATEDSNPQQKQKHVFQMNKMIVDCIDALKMFNFLIIYSIQIIIVEIIMILYFPDRS
jgi:hypothetical protein